MINSQEELVQYLINAEVLESDKIIKAFRAVDRADFVRQREKSQAYQDTALPIGREQTISQPTVVAFMLELLDPRPGDKVLDIGAGSGYTSALLGHIVDQKGQVIGMEIIPELVEFAQANVSQYNFPQVSIDQAVVGEHGYPSKAPYQRILVSASMKEVPGELIDQLEEDGILIASVGNEMVKLSKKDDSIKRKSFPGFVFVPYIED